MDWHKLRLVIAVLVAVPFIIIGLLILRVTGVVSSLPVMIGRNVSVEHLAMKIVYRVVDVDRALTFRDDLLLIFEERFRWSDEYDMDLDRWGLLRQIDLHYEKSKKELREGEFVLSLLGGFLAVVVGVLYNFRYAGVVLAVVILFFSILVVLRVVITELLSYTSFNVKDEPVERLVLYKGWNAAQVNHSSSVVVATLFVALSSSEIGYDLGLDIIDAVGKDAAPVENDRWSADNH